VKNDARYLPAGR